MKRFLIVFLVALVVSSCASTPETPSFPKSKTSTLNSQQAIANVKSVIDRDDSLFLDSINDELVVISSNDKNRVVACRVGFGDKFRSAKSTFYFRRSGDVWNVRSEHLGRAGIGSGDSDVFEFRGVDIPCVSTGYVEGLIFENL